MYKSTDDVVRFLRENNFERGAWSTDLICFYQGEKITRARVESEGYFDMKCHWYELELQLEEELGMYDPDRPRVFYRDKPPMKRV